MGKGGRVRSQRAVTQIDFMLRSRVPRDMTGKVKWFQHIATRPEPVEGGTAKYDTVSQRGEIRAQWKDLRCYRISTSSKMRSLVSIGVLLDLAFSTISLPIKAAPRAPVIRGSSGTRTL